MTITDTQIHGLRSEAANHGDTLQEAICLRALGADPSDAEPGMDLAALTMTVDEARAECERVIASAAAQA
jgi:hypothetical protein